MQKEPRLSLTDSLLMRKVIIHQQLILQVAILWGASAQQMNLILGLLQTAQMKPIIISVQKWLAHNGEMYIEGASYNASGTDFAQMFETVDNTFIDVGYFVTFSSEEKFESLLQTIHSS